MSQIRVFDRVISRTHCRQVMEAMELVEPVPGAVLRNGRDELDHRLRVCTEHPLPTSACPEILVAIRDVTSKALRHDGWRTGQLDGPKFCKYGTGSFFRPHRDNSDSALDPASVLSRRLSVVCFLNDGDTSTGLPVFDGGALVVYVTSKDGPQDPVVVRPTAGSVVVFHADLLHEVRPVKWGFRYSVIGWIYNLTR